MALTEGPPIEASQFLSLDAIASSSSPRPTCSASVQAAMGPKAHKGVGPFRTEARIQEGPRHSDVPGVKEHGGRIKGHEAGVSEHPPAVKPQVR